MSDSPVNMGKNLSLTGKVIEKEGGMKREMPWTVVRLNIQVTICEPSIKGLESNSSFIFPYLIQPCMDKHRHTSRP